MILFLILFNSLVFAAGEFPATVHSPDSILNVAFQSTRNFLKNVYEQQPLTYNAKEHSLTFLLANSSCSYQYKIEIIRATKANSLEENIKLTNCKGDATYIYIYREGKELEETPDEQLFNLKFPAVEGTAKYILDIPLINFRMDYVTGKATFVTTQKLIGKTSVYYVHAEKPDEHFRRWHFVYENGSEPVRSPHFMAQSFPIKNGGRNLLYTFGIDTISELTFYQKFTNSIVGFLTQYFLPSNLNDFMGLQPLNENMSISISF